jgi:hypothetical protein
MSYNGASARFDFVRRATTDRMDDSCFGDGAALKSRALEEAMLLLA